MANTKATGEESVPEHSETKVPLSCLAMGPWGRAVKNLEEKVTIYLEVKSLQLQKWSSRMEEVSQNATVLAYTWVLLTH